MFRVSLVEKLANLGDDDLAELYGGQYQGDIVISDEDVRELEDISRNGKTGLIARRYHWAGAVVPYRVEEKDFSKYAKLRGPEKF